MISGFGSLVQQLDSPGEASLQPDKRGHTLMVLETKFRHTTKIQEKRPRTFNVRDKVLSMLYHCFWGRHPIGHLGNRPDHHSQSKGRKRQLKLICVICQRLSES